MEVNNPKGTAIALLDRMFNIPEGYSSGITNMIVENIIKAAVEQLKQELKDVKALEKENQNDGRLV